MARSKKPATKKLPANNFWSFINTTKQKSYVKFGVLWLTPFCILLGSFFNSVLKNFNYIEIFPHELLIPIGIEAASALLIALMLFWLPWYKTYTGKLVSSLVLALSFINYDPNLQSAASSIKSFVPGLTASDSLPLVSVFYLLILAAISVGIGILLERVVLKWKRLENKDLQYGLLVLVGYLFIIPALSLATKIPTIAKESATTANELSQNQVTASSEKPDIYYLVLDRYTNNQVMKDQFDFDNQDFINFLSQNNFYVRQGAYSNYPYTSMSIASSLNAQYTNELTLPYKNEGIQSRTLYHNLIWQSGVIKALKKAGYSYHALGSSYGATYKAPLADQDYNWQHLLTIFGKEKRLRGIEGVTFVKSPLYRFAQVNTSWWPVKISDRDHIADVRNQVTKLDELTTKEKPGGRFIFSHILVPHPPYAFNANGSFSTVAGIDSVGRPIKAKYVQQVEFINSQLKPLIEQIKRQSNDQAVVIISSDEGPYPQFLNDTFKSPQGTDPASTDAIIKDEDMRKWSDDWLKMKFGILQAVHIPKATPEDLAKLSSVNLFRIVLNRYAGYDLKYLPECQFGLTNGSQAEYNYANITSRFTDTEPQDCSSLQNLPDK